MPEQRSGAKLAHREWRESRKEQQLIARFNAGIELEEARRLA